MSATIPTRFSTVRPIREPGLSDLLRSEWTKLTTIRSTTWSLATMAAVSLAMTVVVTWTFTSSWNTLDSATRTEFQQDTIGLIVQPAAQFGQVAVCVLGVLLMASEYSTGMIRASLLATPRRTPLLTAKAAVFAALTFAVAELVALPCFFIGSAITSRHASTSITDPIDLRAILAFGLFMALMGVIALCIGSMVRHPAGGISLVLALQFVLPGVLSLIPGPIGKHLAGALPANASVMLSSGHNATNTYTPLQGLGILLAWTAVLLAGAYTALKRRDVRS
jgi:ABC-2 type transport system permease protein